LTAIYEPSNHFLPDRIDSPSSTGHFLPEDVAIQSLYLLSLPAKKKSRDIMKGKKMDICLNW